MVSKLAFSPNPYHLLFKPKIFQNVAIANLRDIGCMKIDAISTRGTKRDFIDLFFICKKYKLLNLFGFFEKKYRGIDYNLFHLVKSLSYFANAEDQEMPQMIEEISWKEVKKFFSEETRSLTKKLLEI